MEGVYACAGGSGEGAEDSNNHPQDQCNHRGPFPSGASPPSGCSGSVSDVCHRAGREACRGDPGGWLGRLAPHPGTPNSDRRGPHFRASALRGGPGRGRPAAPRAADRRSWPGAFITAKPDDGDAHPPQSPRSDRSQPRCRRPPSPDDRSRTRGTRCPTRRPDRPAARSADPGHGRPQRRSRRRGRRTRASRNDEGRSAQPAPKRNAATRRQGAESRRPARIERCRRPCPGNREACAVRPIPRVNPDRAGPGFSPRTKKMAEKTRFQREPKWR